MKMLFIPYLMSAFAFGNILFDEPQVPAEVVKSLEEKFPEFSGLEWEESGKLYEANFEIKGRDYEALLNKQGKLLRYKKEIRQEELPEAVRNAIQAEFKDYMVEDCEKVYAGSKKYYQVDLDGKWMDKEVVFTESGERSDFSYWH